MFDKYTSYIYICKTFFYINVYSPSIMLMCCERASWWIIICDCNQEDAPLLYPTLKCVDVPTDKAPSLRPGEW
jgi:hypothetical protein